MKILKTCLKAGHRWGRVMRSEIPDGSWVTIQQCQRRRCDRMLSSWSNGVSFTYRLDGFGSVVDPKTITK